MLKPYIPELHVPCQHYAVDYKDIRLGLRYFAQFCALLLRYMAQTMGVERTRYGFRPVKPTSYRMAGGLLLRLVKLSQNRKEISNAATQPPH